MTMLATPPDPPIIRFDYVKSDAHPLPGDPNHTGPGYDLRPLDTQGQPIPLTGIVIHSSEDPPNQTFAGLCTYLRDSRTVSAHYAIDRTGVIQRILDPGPFRAWHAGYSLYPHPPAPGLRDWNNFAVGIELFHRQGGPGYIVAQYAALTWLCRTLRQDHPTIEQLQIVKHAWIACNPYDQQPPVEYGRKIDPSDWTDMDFAGWRLTL